eukprot:scaffold1342_cov204-Pinguiococcus_pyrenoidosus.AAC.7
MKRQSASTIETPMPKPTCCRMVYLSLKRGRHMFCCCATRSLSRRTSSSCRFWRSSFHCSLRCSTRPRLSLPTRIGAAGPRTIFGVAEGGAALGRAEGPIVGAVANFSSSSGGAEATSTAATAWTGSCIAPSPRSAAGAPVELASDLAVLLWEEDEEDEEDEEETSYLGVFGADLPSFAVCLQLQQSVGRHHAHAEGRVVDEGLEPPGVAQEIVLRGLGSAECVAGVLVLDGAKRHICRLERGLQIPCMTAIQGSW